MEVCLVNTTNPDRIHSFTVQFYTSYDCDISSPVVPVEATGKPSMHYIFRILLIIVFVIPCIADLDYEAVYRESNIIFPPDTNRACISINTYYDDLVEGVETFIVTAVRSSGLGQFSQSPRTRDINIMNVIGK